MTDKLKLFVWEDVLADYFPGLAFAIAKDVNEARKLIKAKIKAESLVKRVREEDKEDLNQEPQVYDLDLPIAFYVHGGA